MLTSDFDFNLPPERIAQIPVEPRDHSKLMVIDRLNKKIEHKHFFDVLDYQKIESTQLKMHIDRVGITIFQR